MTDLKRPILIMMIILGLLMPGGFIYNEEQKAVSDEEDYTGTNENVLFHETQLFSSPDQLKFNNFVYPSPQQGRTRGQNGDLMMDWDGMPLLSDISDAPFQTLYFDNQGGRQFMWGLKNTTITYAPVVANDGAVQINLFTLRLLVHEAVESGGSWRIRREFVNITRNIGPLPGGTNTSGQGLDTSLSWKPEYAGRVRIALIIEVVGDPDLTNNGAYYWPYIMQEYNEVETGAEQNKWKNGAGWSITTLAAIDDPDPNGHSAPTVWEAGASGVQSLKYAVDLSNCKENELPLYGAPNGGSSKGFFIGWKFSGSDSSSTWSFDFWNQSASSCD